MKEGAVFRGQLVVFERNKLLFGGALALAAGGIMAFAGFLAHVFPPGALGMHAAIVGLLLLYATAWRNVRPRKRAARIEATSSALLVDGVARVRRDDIADGFYQPRVAPAYGKPGSSVKLVDRSGRIRFEAEVEHEEQALEILRTMGLDAVSKRAAFRGSSPLYATLGRQMAWVGALVALSMLGSFVLAWVGTSLPFFVMFVLPLSLASAMPSRIVVGIDGILVTWLWQKRFVRMADIRSFTREGDRAIRLDLRSGESLVIHTGMRKRSRIELLTVQHQDRDAVLARMLEAQAAFTSRAAGPNVAALLGRGSRTNDDWLAALKQLGNAQTGYRNAALRDEDLWRVVEDPTATEDARAGAALVLREGLDDEGKARVRVAASATASPTLRVALEAQLGESSDDAAQALEAIAPDEPARQASERSGRN